MNLPEAIGPFQIKGLLEHGPMGDFLHAVERDTGARFTLWSAPSAVVSSATQARLSAEVGLAAPLRGSSYILDILGILNDSCTLVLAPFEGGSLETYVRERGGRLSLFEIREVMQAVLQGLAFSHAKGVLHRGLSARTVFVDTSLRDVRIAGFGIASALETERAWKRTQTLFGDAEYMAPEQFLGQHVDARTDVYSAGILLYRLCTGRVPFSGTGVFEVMQGHTALPFPPPTLWLPSLPPSVSAVIEKACARDREARFPSAAAFWDALQSASTEVTQVLPEAAQTMTLELPVATWGNEARAAAPQAAPSVAPSRPAAGGAASSWAPRAASVPEGAPTANRVASQERWYPGEKPGAPTIVPPTRNTIPWWRRWYTLAGGGLLVGLFALELSLPDETSGGAPAASAGQTTSATPRPARTRPSRAGALGDFAGECAWSLSEPEAADEVLVPLQGDTPLEELRVGVDANGRVSLASKRETLATAHTARVEGLAQVHYWFAEESASHWLLLVTKARGRAPVRVIVAQIVDREIVTWNDLFASQAQVQSVALSVDRGAYSCEFTIAVEGDRGRGSAQKSMAIAPTPAGVVVVDGALADLWSSVEAPESTPFD